MEIYNFQFYYDMKIKLNRQFPWLYLGYQFLFQESFILSTIHVQTKSSKFAIPMKYYNNNPMHADIGILTPENQFKYNSLRGRR